MSLIFNDRVRETATAPGTGVVTLLGAVTGFQTFAAGIGNGNTCEYAIEAVDSDGIPTGGWEVGLGTIGSGTLTRTTVYQSSNSDAAVNFTSSVAVFNTIASKFVQDLSDNIAGYVTGPGSSTDHAVALWNKASGHELLDSVVLIDPTLGDITGVNDITSDTGSWSASTITATSSFIGNLSGNATTVTALQNARTIGGVSFDGTANIVPQTIQSINEATDTTCFPLFISASGSQSLQPLNNAGFSYNSNTNTLTVTTFIGALTGNASTASSAPAGTLTGATLNSGVTASSLTSLGSQAQALNMNSHKINNVTDPTSAQDAATKNYVDNATAGLNSKASSRMATTANIVGTYSNGASGVGATITYTSTGVQTIDGVTPVLLDRVLVKNQTTTFQNGIYVWTTLGAIGIAGILTRATDFDTAGTEVVEGAYTVIEEGTANAGTLWLETGQGPFTIGTTAIVFTELQVANQTVTLTGAITGSGAGSFATSLGSFTSAQLLAALTDETGTGAAVFATSPTLVTPLLGTPTSGNLANCTGLPASAVGAGFVKVDGSTPLTAAWAANNDITGITKLDVDNIEINGNTISSTDTNGNILVAPNGTGEVRLGASATVYWKIDSTGIMNPVGGATYRIPSNTSAFLASAGPAAGLFFSTSANRFNFRDTSGTELIQIPLLSAIYAIFGYSEASISPPQITADQNNYSPTGGQAGVWRLDADAAHNITGIIAPFVARGKHLHLYNLSAFAITLKHLNASSTATNQIYGMGAADVVIAANKAAHLWYDDVSLFWRANLLT
jgi:hypothetical protein